MNLDLSEFGYQSQADERLKSIVEFFWRGGRASASQLAKRFDVTKRTINNDLSLLYFLERILVPGEETKLLHILIPHFSDSRSRNIQVPAYLCLPVPIIQGL